MELWCVHCNKKFIREMAKQVFCTALCRHSHSTYKNSKPVKLTCSTCKEEYSVALKTFYQSKDRTECINCTRKSAKARTMQTRQCLVCGKEYKGKITESKLCSPACAQAAAKKPKEFKRYEKPNTVKANLINKMPCGDCEHGKRSIHSDSGWECLANARICAPLVSQTLYKPKAVKV